VVSVDGVQLGYDKGCFKVGSHDENRRSPRYCFLYQGTGVSTGKKIQNNTGILLALDE